jgi:hypothetical protein
MFFVVVLVKDFLQSATGFGAVITGIAKAIFWPAILDV